MRNNVVDDAKDVYPWAQYSALSSTNVLTQVKLINPMAYIGGTINNGITHCSFEQRPRTIRSPRLPLPRLTVAESIAIRYAEATNPVLHGSTTHVAFVRLAKSVPFFRCMFRSGNILE